MEYCRIEENRTRRYAISYHVNLVFSFLVYYFLLFFQQNFCWAYFSIFFSLTVLLSVAISHCSIICGSLSLFYYLWLSLTVLLSVALLLFYYLWLSLTVLLSVGLSYCSFICGGSLSLSFYLWWLPLTEFLYVGFI